MPARLIAVALAFLWAAPVTPQVVDETMWATNGTVNVVVPDGSTLYIGGQFTWVGPMTGGGVPLSMVSGEPHRPFPKVVGSVRAVVPDGSGGWYIGGAFSAVGGVPRSGLAHILSDGSVAPWNPGVTPSMGSTVMCLAVNGNTVYVGGQFDGIGGQARNNIAALDAITGLASAWNPNASGQVWALAVDGGTVYVGGLFGSIGEQARNRIAALDATTGAATAWNPNADAGVAALAVDGGTVYVGGLFRSIGGQDRTGIAALDATTGAATVWHPNANRWVNALVVNGSTVYVGGGFTRIGGQARNYIAALDVSTAVPTAWDPNANSIVYSLEASGSTIYAGGDFTSIGGQARNHIAALDAATGAATGWDPNASSGVNVLVASGGTVYAGGSFSGLGGQTRRRIAALDATTGVATSWNPNSDGAVSALAVSGGIVYAAGTFTSIGGQARNNIAALDAGTGVATAWKSYASSGVHTLEVSGRTIYVGWRDHIAALDATTGAATGWHPDPSNYRSPTEVSALVVNGGVVYVGGWFNRIGGEYRNWIAAVDAATGAATDWNPGANSSGTTCCGVEHIAVGEGTVYASGKFDNIGGLTRRGIAALDATTGAATPWDPSAGSYARIDALMVNDNTVYVGGYFDRIGGQERHVLAALDGATGAATAWDPKAWDPNHYPAIHTLAASENTLYVGGDFTYVGEEPRHGLAAFSLTPLNRPPDCSGATASLDELWPPNHQLVRVEILGVTDPDGDPVTITVMGVTQDEPVLGKGDGNTCPDAVLADRAVSLRAERSGQGNGRVYAISFRAADGNGGVCEGSVRVCVPHDQGLEPDIVVRRIARRDPPTSASRGCADDGDSQDYDALGSCPARGKGVTPEIAQVGPLSLDAGMVSGNLAIVSYSLSHDCDVELAVHDIGGRRVRVVESGPRSAGTHEAHWDAGSLTPGVYFYRLRAGGEVVSRSVLVLR